MVDRPARRHRRGGVWGAGVALSLAAHLAALIAFLSIRPPADVFSLPDPPEAVVVDLTPPPIPSPPPKPEPEPTNEAAQTEASAAAPEPEPPAPSTVARPAPPRPAARLRPARLPPPPEVETVAASPAPPTPAPPAPPAGLTASQLAGAATAGSGTGGGSGSGTGSGAGGGSGGGGGSGRCDMIQRVQDALRENTGVVAATRRAQALLPSDRRALLVWDGDWVMNPGEAGRGLAGLRQAIAVEIAFAPAECRRQAERGLVLLTLAEGPGAARLALGTGSWRWSDLTGVR
ncbi:MAG: hypothetical protein B7Z01_04615 [Brevundimonas subvibrioides]|uniref:Uncharacterized protein n=1 Tax=Brevundimonas subvibrioides TaxID=74313 RepID=A0A258FQN8_9CAUL|nr:MAG: hypothetical protein B7Z01_04615 [Brevundimonas subvibrioides]